MPVLARLAAWPRPPRWRRVGLPGRAVVDGVPHRPSAGGERLLGHGRLRPGDVRDPGGGRAPSSPSTPASACRWWRSTCPTPCPGPACRSPGRGLGRALPPAPPRLRSAGPRSTTSSSGSAPPGLRRRLRARLAQRPLPGGALRGAGARGPAPGRARGRVAGAGAGVAPRPHRLLRAALGRPSPLARRRPVAPAARLPGAAAAGRRLAGVYEAVDEPSADCSRRSVRTRSSWSSRCTTRWRTPTTCRPSTSSRSCSTATPTAGPTWSSARPGRAAVDQVPPAPVLPPPDEAIGTAIERAYRSHRRVGPAPPDGLDRLRDAVRRQRPRRPLPPWRHLGRRWGRFRGAASSGRAGRGRAPGLPRYGSVRALLARPGDLRPADVLRHPPAREPGRPRGTGRRRPSALRRGPRPLGAATRALRDGRTAAPPWPRPAHPARRPVRAGPPADLVVRFARPPTCWRTARRDVSGRCRSCAQGSTGRPGSYGSTTPADRCAWPAASSPARWATSSATCCRLPDRPDGWSGPVAHPAAPGSPVHRPGVVARRLDLRRRTAAMDPSSGVAADGRSRRRLPARRPTDHRRHPRGRPGSSPHRPGRRKSPATCSRAGPRRFTEDLRLWGRASKLRGASQAPERDATRRGGSLNLSERRELNNGFGEALSRAFEIAVTPAIFGVGGYLLDRKLGVVPLLPSSSRCSSSATSCGSTGRCTRRTWSVTSSPAEPAASPGGNAMTAVPGRRGRPGARARRRRATSPGGRSGWRRWPCSSVSWDGVGPGAASRAVRLGLVTVNFLLAALAWPGRPASPSAY